jgi:hypothetical protein
MGRKRIRKKEYSRHQFSHLPVIHLPCLLPVSTFPSFLGSSFAFLSVPSHPLSISTSSSPLLLAPGLIQPPSAPQLSSYPVANDENCKLYLVNRVCRTMAQKTFTANAFNDSSGGYSFAKILIQLPRQANGFGTSGIRFSII